MDKDHKVFYSDLSLKNLIEPIGFVYVKKIIMPLNLKFLSKILSQYCTILILKNLNIKIYCFIFLYFEINNKLPQLNFS